MLCTGLFDPLAGWMIKFMKGDPLRVFVGTVLLATLVSLDGDGTTTIMICCAALLPVYDKLKLSRVWLGVFVIVPNSAINLLPWGGPTARLLAVMDLDSRELLIHIIPLIVTGIVMSLVIAVVLGLKERKRLGITELDVDSVKEEIAADRQEFSRPGLIWFNFILRYAHCLQSLPSAYLAQLSSRLLPALP